MKNYLTLTPGEALIIAGFTGIGKTYLAENRKDLKIFDFNDQEINKLGPSLNPSDPDYVKNYIKHVKKIRGEYDIILIPSYSQILKTLGEMCIKYTLVYPTISQKNQYLNRVPPYTLEWQLMFHHWERLIDLHEHEMHSNHHIILDPDEYLSNVIPEAVGEYDDDPLTTMSRFLDNMIKLAVSCNDETIIDIMDDILCSDEYKNYETECDEIIKSVFGPKPTLTWNGVSRQIYPITSWDEIANDIDKIYNGDGLYFPNLELRKPKPIKVKVKCRRCIKIKI